MQPLRETGNERSRRGHVIALRFLKLLNVLAVSAVFAVVWRFWVSDRTAAPYYRVGNYVVVGLFLVLYYQISHLYGGFRIQTSRISELIYSQALGAFLANVFLYIVSILLMKRLPRVKPFLIGLGVQMLLITHWCLWVHQWYFKVFPRKKTVIIWDTRGRMQNLMQAYGLDHHFDVIGHQQIAECLRTDMAILKDAETVFLYGIHSSQRNQINKYCIASGKEVFVIPRVGDVIMAAGQPMPLFHLPMWSLKRYSPSPEHKFAKRAFDIVFSLAFLILFSPVMLVTAIAVKATDGGPVFYRQKRLTLDGRVFEILKFRSMREDAESDGVARLSSGENDDRITPVGRVIRKTRIDELPQLFNILKGEMAVVGPRPERPEIAEKYTRELPEFALRLQMKAGLTGYAQVYGKYNSAPYDKLLMDLMYIANPSFAEDFKIMLATFKILFIPESTEGIEEGQTTAMAEGQTAEAETQASATAEAQPAEKEKGKENGE